MSTSPLALSPSEILRKIEYEDREISRLLNIYHDERAAQMNRRSLAEERYEKELREIADLDEIDADLERIEAERHGVDHNIMRLTNTTFYSDSDEYENDEDDEDNLEIDDVDTNEKKKKGRKRGEPQIEVQMRTNYREPPSFEMKEGMREALFGYMEASREDERRLEMEYEGLKDTGMRMTKQSQTVLSYYLMLTIYLYFSLSQYHP